VLVSCYRKTEPNRQPKFGVKNRSKPTGNAKSRTVTTLVKLVFGLFVPLHFRSLQQKVHRENFSSHGTFVPWNICSRGAKSPRTFVPWNFCTPGTFAPQERMFQELSFRGTIAPVERSLHKQLSCPYFHSCGTFAAVLKKQESNVSIDVCWQTFAAVCL